MVTNLRNENVALTLFVMGFLMDVRFMGGGGLKTTPSPPKIWTKRAMTPIFCMDVATIFYFSEIIISGAVSAKFCWRQHFCWWRHNLRIYRKMTSRAVKWRHHVGFSPNLQEMFLFVILCCGVNMKLFAWFKRKLRGFLYFQLQYGNI